MAMIMCKRALLVVVALLGTCCLAAADNRYIGLDYIVEASDYSVPGADINPRYLLLSDGRLVYPVQTILEENRTGPDLQTIELFIIDLHAGRAARIGKYERVYGLSIVKAQDDDELYFGIRVSPERQGAFRDYRLDAPTLSIEASSLREIVANRSDDQPGGVDEYPESLLNITENDLYRSTRSSSAAGGVGAYAWRRWHDYVVGLGQGNAAQEEYALNLYYDDGSRAYGLPLIRVYYQSFTYFPHVIQVSPDGELLMLHEPTASGMARRSFSEARPDRAMYFWSFADDDPTEYHPTRLYYANSPDFGSGYDVGEWFEMESEVVNGAPFSTGPTYDKESSCE